MAKTNLSFTEERKLLLYNFGFQEFTQHGYKRASLNNIIESANVSKGLFYHHYSSKKNFFEAISQHAFYIIETEMRSKIDWSITDVIERIIHVLRLRTKILTSFPFIFEFIFSNFIVDANSNNKKLFHKVKFLEEIKNDVISKNIDFSLFKKNIDKDKAIQIINWTLESIVYLGIQEYINSDLTKKNISLDKTTELFEEYASTLRAAFYN